MIEALDKKHNTLQCKITETKQLTKQAYNDKKELTRDLATYEINYSSGSHGKQSCKDFRSKIESL